MGKDRFRIMAAVHLLFKKGNEILLLERQNTGHRDGEYGLVAGHLEPFETLEECALREAMEEAGVKVMPEDLQFFHVFANTKREYVNFFFVVEQWEGEPQIMEPEKCAKLTWFDIGNLPENTIPYIFDAVEAYKKEIYFSENILDY